MSKLKNQTLVLYQIDDVIETIGPLECPPDLLKIRTEYTKNSNNSSMYEFDTEMYMENKKYYVNIFVSNIVEKDLAKKGMI